MNKTIGFFGDSFCEFSTHPHAIKNNYQTYIQKLSDHFNSKITNLGVAGSSVWDLYILQFNTLTSIPDVCVFVWTDPYRLYHRHVRNITLASLSVIKPRSDIRNIWNSAIKYYQNLYDEEKHILEYKSMIYFFDNEVLSNISDSKKIIHLYSFESTTTLHNWKHGVTIKPSLNEIAALNNDKFDYFDVPNHISGKFRNDIIFNCIKRSIENYDNKSVTFDLNEYIKI